MRCVINVLLTVLVAATCLEIAEAACQDQTSSGEALPTGTRQAQVAEHWKTGTRDAFVGVDGVTIVFRTFVKKDQVGAVVISSGRTECMLKYEEVIYDLGQWGYSVYILDHRGQGFSGRMTSKPQVGHVEEFDDYVADLKAFVDRFVLTSQAELSVPSENKRLFLLAHSMGGCIASLYLERHKAEFSAAVLCSPMHQPSTGFIPENLVKQVAESRFKEVFDRKDDYAFGKGAYKDVKYDEITDHQNDALTHSEVRYERVRLLYNTSDKVKIGGPSFNWVKEAIEAGRRSRKDADQIEIPVLLLQAGGDSIVAAEGQSEFAAKAGSNCRLQVIPEAYHELLVESDVYRSPAMRMIREFFDRHHSR